LEGRKTQPKEGILDQLNPGFFLKKAERKGRIYYWGTLERSPQGRGGFGFFKTSLVALGLGLVFPKKPI